MKKLMSYMLLALIGVLPPAKAADSIDILQDNQSVIVQLPANLDFMIGISNASDRPEGIYSNQKIHLLTTKKLVLKQDKVVENVKDPKKPDPFVVIILQKDQAIHHIIQTKGSGRNARNHKIDIKTPLMNGSYRLNPRSRILSKQIAPLQVIALAKIGTRAKIKLNPNVLTFDSLIRYANDGM